MNSAKEDFSYGIIISYRDSRTIRFINWIEYEEIS